MGQESARYFLSVGPDLHDAVVAALCEGGAEAGATHSGRRDLRLYAEFRYWIDLRLHCASKSQLEIRIALTNDDWSIRRPLEVAFAALPPAAAARPLHDEDGTALGAPADAGWSMRLEDDYRRRRALFVERVGDLTAPISADHVYLYLHQAGRHRDGDAELAWHREREISRLEEMWDPPAARPELPPDHPHAGESPAG